MYLGGFSERFGSLVTGQNKTSATLLVTEVYVIEKAGVAG